MRKRTLKALIEKIGAVAAAPHVVAEGFVFGGGVREGGDGFGVEPVDRGEMLRTLQVVAPDLHLLAGQLVADHVHLQLGVARVIRLREAGDHLVERLEGEVRARLVAAHIDDLVEMADRHEKIGRAHV